MSVVLNEEPGKSIENVVQQASGKIEKLLEDNSPQKMSWQEQMKALKLGTRDRCDGIQLSFAGL